MKMQLAAPEAPGRSSYQKKKIVEKITVKSENRGYRAREEVGTAQTRGETEEERREAGARQLVRGDARGRAEWRAATCLRDGPQEHTGVSALGEDT